MAGFDNGVVYGSNVDFTGTTPVSGQINLDGELLVGAATAPFIRAYVPTGSGGVSISTGPGTIDFSLANIPNSSLQNSTINITAGAGISVAGSPVSLGGNVVISATGGSAVTSVSGTANRITSTGGTTPVIDISASYVGQSSITTLGTIGSGIWNGTVITGTYGGTGVNNGASTITLGGNLTTSGAFASTFTMTNTTGVTFPTSGTLATTAQIPALPVTVPNGGTGVVTLTNHGVLLGQAASNITATTAGSSGQILTSQGGAADPTWTTATFPATATGTSKILVADGTNWVASTPTFPNASATSGKVIKSDGTNWTASTETYAAPSTSGNFMVSDGTNWTSTSLSGLAFTASITLTSAQIKALHATPIQIVGAPGSGKVIFPIQWLAKFTYGGSNVFVAGASQSIKLYWGTASVTSSNTLLTNGSLVGTTTGYQLATFGGSASLVTTANCENLALNAYNDVVTEISGNAGNNNTLHIAVFYCIVTL